jgi:hypothetical protein
MPAYAVVGAGALLVAPEGTVHVALTRPTVGRAERLQAPRQEPAVRRRTARMRRLPKRPSRQRRHAEERG